ncbi:MAG: hypothetical protein H0T79_21695 [Deltaproteobacteria bacterium]|nr:hypothetical protein [Deltaproteobacteria bacterium]
MAATEVVPKPRFKQELVAEPIEENGAKFVDVMDPDSGNVFRFFEVEYALACAMDGERDVPGIMKWAQEELGLTPSPTEVRTVIRTLGNLGYLDGADTIEAPARVVESARPAAQAVVPSRTSSNELELARGVVAAAPVSRQDATHEKADFELGNSGTTKPAPTADLPAAPDFGLGKSGAATTPKAPVAPVEQFALGHSGVAAASAAPASTDVSLDLSDNMKIQLDDVKEAVRASKVMTAVEVPKELLAELEASDKKSEAAAAAAAAAAKPEARVAEAKVEPKADKKPEVKVEPKADKKPEAKVAEAKVEPKADKKPEPKTEPKTEAKPEAKVDAKADKKPEPKTDTKADKRPEAKPAVEQPKKPIVEDKKPVAPPAKGTSPVLVAFLVLVVLGAGAFFLWKFVLNKPAEGEGKAVGTLPGSANTAPVGSGSAVGSAAEAMPVAPVEPPSKLALETPAPLELKSLTGGVIETIEANDKVVKKGDVVARLVGGKPLQTEIATLSKDIEGRLPKEIDAATKAVATAEAGGDAAAIASAKTHLTDRQLSLTKKSETLATKRDELAKFTVLAPVDGKLAVTAKAGDRIAAPQAVASIVSEPMLVATFKMKDPMPAAGAAISLIHKTSGKAIECTVADAKDGNVKVQCANDPLGAIKADDEVTLK